MSKSQIWQLNQELDIQILDLDIQIHDLDVHIWELDDPNLEIQLLEFQIKNG